MCVSNCRLHARPWLECHDCRTSTRTSMSALYRTLHSGYLYIPMGQDAISKQGMRQAKPADLYLKAVGTDDSSPLTSLPPRLQVCARTVLTDIGTLMHQGRAVQARLKDPCLDPMLRVPKDPTMATAHMQRAQIGPTMAMGLIQKAPTMIMNPTQRAQKAPTMIMNPAQRAQKAPTMIMNLVQRGPMTMTVDLHLHCHEARSAAHTIRLTPFQHSISTSACYLCPKCNCTGTSTVSAAVPFKLLPFSKSCTLLCYYTIASMLLQHECQQHC